MMRNRFPDGSQRCNPLFLFGKKIYGKLIE